jgi:hypothetical protein
MKASGQFHTPGRFTQGKEPRYPLNRRLGDSFGKKSFAPGGIPTSERPARS